MPPFRDDQIFIISPGSQTTLAQLGLPESFTPARHRFRSRMFPAQTPGQYEPVKIRPKERSQAQPPPSNGATTNGEAAPAGDEEQDWEEDRVSEEGAIWPLVDGRVTDWPCFCALLTHVYNTVNPPFHTPVLLIAPPAWAFKEHERVTQFFFEKFKVPAFALMDSALASTYAYGVPTATVVDVGFTKADVSCVADFMLQTTGRSVSVQGCGGEALTSRLVELLKGRKGFTRDVCEQLKRSPICEVLGADAPLPGDEAAVDASTNPAAAASTGADGAEPGQRKASVVGDLPRGPGPGTEVGEEKKAEDEDGVLDIASIVTGGNMNEYLAQKEKEKQEKAAAKQQQKKANDPQQQQLARAARLPNSKRSRNTFVYEDFALHEAMKKAGMNDHGMANMQSALDDGPNKRQKTPEPTAEKPADGVVNAAGGLTREIEVGTERFQAASGGILETLADTIHRTVLSCNEINKRSELWDSLIILGNGAKVRGFKEALVDTLQKKYIISPSSATIFTSELPSNLSTPMGTGAQTPQPHQQHAPLGHHHGGVNPLLLAATTAQNPQLQQHASAAHLGQPGAVGGPMAHASHTSHAQTPTSIKLARIPEYFPEWKELGYDEATFLGAQVAAKVLFINDGGASNGYMTRTGYNEQGPGGIHETML